MVDMQSLKGQIFKTVSKMINMRLKGKVIKL